jgi:hypothetical protein
MSTFRQFFPFFQILLILILAGVLIRRKQTGRWKRPWSFPVAMGLLALAIVLVALAQVLSHFGM